MTTHRRNSNLDITTPFGLVQSLPEKLFKPKPSQSPKPIKSVIKNLRFKHLAFLFFIWLLIVHYHERTTVYRSIKKCQWANWEDWPQNSDPHHAIIIGDPQIVDDFSYPNRSSILLSITKKLSDNYLHRNHKIYNEILKPQSTLFIGDLFDGGREWEDEVWFNEYERFHRIFDEFDDNRMFKALPGNHDIGFGNDVNTTVYDRFRAFFGDVNDYYVLGNHSVVLIDTIALSARGLPYINKEPTDFLNELEAPNHPSKDFPRVLLTHVPLYRFTEVQTCGPLRESQKKFPMVKGKQYQTAIEFDLSEKILDNIKPKIIFSGDDHDYCHIRHPYGIMEKGGEIVGDPGVDWSDEVTIKSSAMTGGIRKPAIQLLSLWNPQQKIKMKSDIQFKETGSMIVEQETLKSRICYLPEPYHTLRTYGLFTGLSVLSLSLCILIPTAGLKLNNSIKSVLVKRRLLVDPDLLQPKKTVKGIKEKLLDWDISETPDLRSFILHVLLLLVLYISVLRWYFNSI